jgi:hypothetical protein
LRASKTGKDGLVPSMYAITFSTRCALSNTNHIIIIIIIITMLYLHRGKKLYMTMSRRQIRTRFNEHIHYIRYNNPKSAYAQHILNNSHQYGNIKDTLQLVKVCTKGWHMTCCENYFIQFYQHHGLLISEQTVNDPLTIDKCTT